MSSSYGERFRFTIFGQSHSDAIGVTMEGIPAGFAIDMDALQAFLCRRAPGGSAIATARKEADRPEFLSGLVNGVTCGTPITAVIRNTDARSADYDTLRDCPRPGHADYTGHVRYGGHQDSAGGGHFSGRLTAPLCIAGGLCLQLLEQQDITVGAHIRSIGSVEDSAFDPVTVAAAQLRQLGEQTLPVLTASAAEAMTAEILAAKAAGDSVGGIIECAAVGLPAGWGDPMFGGM